MTEKIRIKDIALRAGVSVGTVDRVLHERPNVSKKALESVQNAIREMNYQPNMYASALAYNRSYTFYLIIPEHSSEPYWSEIEEGIGRAVEARRDFRINVKKLYYSRLSEDSFKEQYEECLKAEPAGVILVPASLTATRTFTEQLHDREIPFILLDSYMPDLQPLAFFGQDSFSSGYFAAKMFMLIASREKEVMLMRLVDEHGNLVSKQQMNREVGFSQYMREHFPEVTISKLDLHISATQEQIDDALEEFFTTHPDVHHCITVNSRAHLVGEYALRNNRKDIQIMGYDMVGKNVECIRKGSISFLIAQHAFQQGYSSVDTLFKSIILKKRVDAVNYMPIELLSKENVDYYRRTQL
ncbi:MAG: LacI family DNA-binding transcriptional regulator [Prevotella sp.]|jgi:LacI family transcriptional regulator|nr:LacI family DNA-binding transcriptional regulator [Prevotella sp.]